MTSSNPLREASLAADRRDWSAAADLLLPAATTEQVLDKRGWYLSRAKRYDEAIRAFTELRNRRPDDYRPPYMIGFQLYQQQRWRESLDWFAEALRLRPDHIKSWWRRAYALQRLGQDREAAIAAGRVLQLWHQLPRARQDEDRKLLARASHLLGRRQLATDPAGAADLLAQAATNDPDDPYHHYLLAKALRRAGRRGDALAPASMARRLKPGDPNIELEYAAALHAHGRDNEAATCIRRASRRCSGWTAYRAGTLAMRAGVADLAVELLRRAGRDRASRGALRVQQALDEALSLAGDMPISMPETASEIERGNDASSHGTPRRRRRVRTRSAGAGGTVDLIRHERGFGFLVDESGIRRHFRLPRQSDLAKGQSVTFTPTDTEKGPAARDVRPA